MESNKQVTERDEFTNPTEKGHNPAVRRQLGAEQNKKILIITDLGGPPNNTVIPES